MPKLIVLVGPPGVGKSTTAIHEFRCYSYINQDSQGKTGHLDHFKFLLENKHDIIVDRMGFNKQQRDRYLKPAKEAGYETKIVVLHENRETCLKRIVERRGHETINQGDTITANKALDTFFTKYERPEPGEADEIEFRYPKLGMELNAVVSDIDNTLSDSNHRQAILDNNGGKKNWKGFFDAMNKDPVNEWCKDILESMREKNIIVLCSGRPDSYRNVTEKWLKDNNIHYDNLFMRHRSDSRPDTVIKEIILDFEIKTRFKNIKFWLDDRKCVIDKIRDRNVLVLDCAGPKGDF